MSHAFRILTLRALLLGAIAVPVGPSGARAAQSPKPQVVKVSVTNAGFVPAVVKVRRDAPITLLITRKTDHTCATQAVFPSIDKTVDLPLNKAVAVALPAQSSGRLGFACGMGMFKGEIVVR
jgi:plastocyanin domain-containing protein